MIRARAISVALSCVLLSAYAPTVAVAAQTVRANTHPCAFPFQTPDIPWDSVGQLVAGIKGDPYANSFAAEQKDAWTTYSRGVSADWRRLKARYLDKIDVWRGRALGNLKTHNVGFYPFSGPDVANLLTFFPDEHEYVLVGLEPVGCIPPSAEDYTPAYFSDLRKSVQSIVALGFFKTNDMKRDFSGASDSAVQGVLPALLLFVSRAGYTVVDVTPVGIARDGSVVANLEQPKRETRGVAIQFKDARHGVRTLRYFSLNLQNPSLQRKPGTLRYLQSLASADTLVKSASYLMHKRYFSTIRSVILTQSQVVAEDDSGIPYHFFDAANWDVHLYGTYTKPIALFKNSEQDDLREAYASTPGVQPLEFGIGYRFQSSQSNLLLAVHRPAPQPAGRGK